MLIIILLISQVLPIFLQFSKVKNKIIYKKNFLHFFIDEAAKTSFHTAIFVTAKPDIVDSGTINHIIKYDNH